MRRLGGLVVLAALIAPGAASAAGPVPSVGEVAMPLSGADAMGVYTGLAGAEDLRVAVDRANRVFTFHNPNGIIVTNDRNCTASRHVATCRIPAGASNLSVGVSLGPGTDRLQYGGDAPAHIAGGDGDDVLRGGVAGDIIDGNAGHDVLLGLAGDDILVGDHPADIPGRDQIFGGDGDDFIDAQDEVADHVDCGAGADAGYHDLGLDTLAGCENFFDPTHG